jgi:hypothetical protein
MLNESLPLQSKDEILDAVANVLGQQGTSTSPELDEIARALLTSPEISIEEKVQLYNSMVNEWSYGAQWHPNLKGINLDELPGLNLAFAEFDK